MAFEAILDRGASFKKTAATIVLNACRFKIPRALLSKGRWIWGAI